MMATPLLGYNFERLNSGHDRAAFSCGTPALDHYLQTQARQHADRDLAAVFVMTQDSRTIAGFYTLSAAGITAEDVPESHRKKLPRFPVPVTLLGRMAVTKDLQGRGLGDALLADALYRALEGTSFVGSWAVVVDTKVGARSFYLKHNFIPLPSQPDRMFLMMDSIKKISF